MKLNLAGTLSLLFTLNLLLTNCGQGSKKLPAGNKDLTNPGIEEPEFPESEPVTMEQFNELSNQLATLNTMVQTVSHTSDQNVSELKAFLNQRLEALEVKFGAQNQVIQKQSENFQTNVASIDALKQDMNKKIELKESQILQLNETLKNQQNSFTAWMTQKEQQLKSLEQSNLLLSGQLTASKADSLKMDESQRNTTQGLSDNLGKLQKNITDLGEQYKSELKSQLEGLNSKFLTLINSNKTELTQSIANSIETINQALKDQNENVVLLKNNLSKLNEAQLKTASDLLNTKLETQRQIEASLKSLQLQIQTSINNHTEAIERLEIASTNQKNITGKGIDEIFSQLEQMNVTDQQSTDRLKTNETNILSCQNGMQEQADSIRVISSVVAGTATGLRKSDTAIADINKRLSPMQFVNIENKPSIVFNGVNVHIRNGAGSTYNTNNGLGNLILGYNEQPGGSNYSRSGSHNILVGQNHEYLSTASLVVGVGHRVEGHSNAIIGGVGNQITAAGAVIIGGKINKVTEPFATSVGGSENQVRGQLSVNIGGLGNVIEGTSSVTLGGFGNNIKPTATFGASLGGSRNSIESVYGTAINGTENNVSKDAIGGLIVGGIKQSVSQLYQTLIGSN